MNRLQTVLEESRRAGRKALVVYVCAGDPDLASTERLVPLLAEAGADVIELGVPFSDPLADGPTIQAASQRALRSGTSLAGVLDLVERLRQSRCQVPLVLFGYMNPILRMGLAPFAARAAQAGADGVLVPDLPLEEAGPLRQLAESQGLSLVLLAAPTTPPERLKAIGAATSGFLYFVSVTGVTGARAELSGGPPQPTRSWPGRQPRYRWRWASASPRRPKRTRSPGTPTPWWWEAPWWRPFTAAARTRALALVRSLSAAMR